MSLIGSVRSLFGGGQSEAFGEGQKSPLTKHLTLEIKRHIAELSRKDLVGYTFERRRSEYPQAKSDLVVYNQAGTPVLHGREMSGGEFSFWSK
jgi:hypothetical protein